MNEEDNSDFRKYSQPPVFTNSSDTNYTLTGLLPYTVYNFQVKKGNEIFDPLPLGVKIYNYFGKNSSSKMSCFFDWSLLNCVLENDFFFQCSTKKAEKNHCRKKSRGGRIFQKTYVSERGGGITFENEFYFLRSKQ